MTDPWPADASTILHEVDGAFVVDVTTRDGLVTRYISRDRGRTWLDPDAVSALLDCDGEGIPADPTLPLKAETARLKGKLAASIERNRRKEVEAIAEQRGLAEDARRARQAEEKEAQWTKGFPCPKERLEAQKGRSEIMADWNESYLANAKRREGLTIRERLREDDDWARHLREENERTM